MKKLNELYQGTSEVEIKNIRINSKEVEPGDLFVCTMGVTADRHLFVEDAVARGAVAIVASKPVTTEVPVVYVEDTNQELPELCARFYDHPEKELAFLGVTGTNGKTTVAEIVQDLLGDDLCAYLGTNGISCSLFHESVRNTTPDSDYLFPYLRRFVDAGFQYLSMEVSSEAMYRKRLTTIFFDVAVFTCIGQEHLNIHGTMENYVDSKCALFRQVKKDGFCILNRDDPYYETFLKACNGKVITYGKDPTADFRITSFELCIDRTILSFDYEGKSYCVESPLLCEYNVWNLAAAMLVLKTLGFEMEEIISRIPWIGQNDGRMELLQFGQDYSIVLDYAHNPLALQRTLEFLNQIKKNRLITVTGTAGGRDRDKRPVMGKIVLEQSDYVIFTLDDPRREAVDQIIDDLVGDSQMTNYKRIPDRKEAIFYALSIAQKGDIVFLAGKGRDNYMAIGEEYLPYNEYEVVKSYFDIEQS